MAQVRLVIMNKDNSPGSISCGVGIIDEQINNAYSKTLFKQAVAYNITVDGYLVGNCMLKLVWLHDEDEEYYVSDKEFIAMELVYLAIDKRFQRKGIGTSVLKMLIQEVSNVVSTLPIRFFVLDAFKDKEHWYTSAGFKRYPKVEDLRYPGTVPMRMDFIDIAVAEQYAESLA